MAAMGPSRLELSKPVIAAVAGPAVAGGVRGRAACGQRWLLPGKSLLLRHRAEGWLSPAPHAPWDDAYTEPTKASRLDAGPDQGPSAVTALGQVGRGVGGVACLWLQSLQ